LAIIIRMIQTSRRVDNRYRVVGFLVIRMIQGSIKMNYRYQVVVYLAIIRIRMIVENRRMSSKEVGCLAIIVKISRRMISRQ